MASGCTRNARLAWGGKPTTSPPRYTDHAVPAGPRETSPIARCLRIGVVMGPDSESLAGRVRTTIGRND